MTKTIWALEQYRLGVWVALAFRTSRADALVTLRVWKRDDPIGYYRVCAFDRRAAK